MGALVSGTAPERPISVRRHAVDALGLLGKRGLRVQPLLRKLLVEKDTQLRKAAVMALLKQRGEALPVVPDLLEMLRQDSELADCLEMAIEIITGKPSLIGRPHKSGVKMINLGRAAYDSPMYQRGWTINIISGNPPAKQPADTPSKQEEKGKQG